MSGFLPFFLLSMIQKKISEVLSSIFREAKVYGVICFGMGLTLREGNREYFYEQLDQLFPTHEGKILQTYGEQYQVNSPHNEALMKLFHQLCEDNGIIHGNSEIFQYLNKFEEKNEMIQLSLFDM